MKTNKTKIAKTSKKKQPKIKEWGSNHKTLLLASVSIAVFIGIALYASVFSGGSHNKATETSVPVAEKGKATLSITSDPTGIQMTASDPICDSSKLSKTTPYTCSKETENFNTIITAPATVALKGKTYTFNTWDGCSESNANKNICKVEMNSRSIHTIKAAYTLSTMGASGTGTKNSTAPNQADKPPANECISSPNTSGTVTCKTTVFQVPFVYAITVSFPQDNQGRPYYAEVVKNPYIYCNSSNVCDTINHLPNTVPNIVGGLKQPGTMFVNLLPDAETNDGKKLVFDHWSTVYDPTRYPINDPNQHTVYFVTAYYVLAPNQ